MGDNKTESIKIVVLGAGGVGKSALTLRLISGEFGTEYDPTIEDSYRKQVTIDGKTALLDILDTAGQEEYSSLQDQWIREGDGYLLVYSITESNTLEACQILYNKIERIRETSDSPIVLAGNKCDLENNRKVSREEDKNVASKLGCSFMEASAKTSINTNEVFFQLVRNIRQKNKKQVVTEKKGGLCTLL